MGEAITTAQGVEPATASESKYLTFAIKGEEYGVSILRVREIIGVLPITVVPEAPVSIRGVINLRGRIIPVMDLRKRFGFEGDSAELERACIIVLEVTKGDDLVDVGVLVDEVNEVIAVNEADIECPPDLNCHKASNCIAGLINQDGEVRILIDVNQLLTEKQMREAVSAQPALVGAES